MCSGVIWKKYVGICAYKLISYSYNCFLGPLVNQIDMITVTNDALSFLQLLVRNLEKEWLYVL